MAQEPTDRETIRKYLLAELAEPQRRAFEERLVLDDSIFEELQIVEDELVDAYLLKQLTGSEKAQFETVFLATPERRDKLRFAKVFRHYVDTNQPTTQDFAHSILRTSTFSLQKLPARVAALALVIIVVGGVWLYIRSIQKQPSFATITLSLSPSNRATGAEAGKLKLPLNADSVRVVLKLPAGLRAASYRVELENQAGEMANMKLIEETSSSLTVAIPASQLKPGRYALKLFANNVEGVETRVAGNYFFTVE